MLDIGFIGHVATGGSLPLAIQCRDSEFRPASPTNVPAFTIYPDGFSSWVASGSLGASDTGGKVGFRTASLTISTATYSAGELYTVLFEYRAGGQSRTAIGTFLVD
jgi:hypothetical protein